MSKSLAWAALAGVVVTWLCYQALAPTGAPVLVARVVAGGDLGEMGYRGGIRVSYRSQETAEDHVTSEQYAETMRQLTRRAERVGTLIQIVSVSGGFDLTLAGVAEAEAEDVALGLVRRGQLGFHRVVAGSELMRRLVQRATTMQGSVQGDSEFWTRWNSSEQREDWYLTAATPAQLEAFLAGAARADPELAAEPGRTIAFEQVPARSWDDNREAVWRTYYVESAPALENRDIDSAVATEDPMTGAPVVMLYFNEPGSQRWAEFTAASVGDKVTIVLDGTVLSAPVIQSPIHGGTAMISMGTSGPESMTEARILASLLMVAESGRPAFPLALTVTALEYVPPRVTHGQLRAARGLYALVLGLAMFALVLVVDSRLSRGSGRAPGVDDGAEPETSAAPGERGWPVVPLLVTVGAAMVVYFFPDVALPGVDGERAAMLPGGGPDRDSAMRFSVFALGIMPIMSAFVLVELAALIVPAWRPLRHGGPGARARLGRATIMVSMAMALIQGYLIADWLSGLALDGWDVVPDPGMRFVVVAMLTLSAGAMVYWVVAALVSRYGIGNGFAVIMFAGLLGQARMVVPMLEHLDLGSVDMLVLVVAVPGVMVMTSALLRVRVAGLSLPTCGIIPIHYAASLILLAQILALAGWVEPMAWVADLEPGSGGHRVVYAGTLIGLAVLLSWLFSRPALIAGAARLVRHGHRPGSQRMFWAAVAVSTAYLLVASLVHMAVPDSVTALLSLPAIIMITAIAMDLLAEWRARRQHRDLIAVWPLHRVQATDLALSALGGAGIEAHARGRYFRALFHFFAPFVAIEILVPSAHADRARDILAGL